MSWLCSTTIHCDRCEDWTTANLFGHTTRLQETRNEIREWGWKYLRGIGDVCPQCLEKMNEDGGFGTPALPEAEQ